MIEQQTERRWVDFCAFAPAGGMPVRGDDDILVPAGRAHDNWLSRFRAERMARQVAEGLRRELPGLLVEDRPEVVDGVWTLRVVVPAGIVPTEMLAGTAAENVPWLPDSEPGRLRVPFSLGYSDEERDQLVLVAAKVIHYLRKAGEPITS
jgi:hypothetical protein